MSLRVLLVEDNKQNRILAKTVLGLEGHTVIEAENGARALQTLDRDPVDVVVLDLQLPDIDGFELARRLRKDPRFSRLPIIAATAFAGADQRQKAEICGLNGFIEKPIDVETFAARVAAYAKSLTASHESAPR